MVYNHKEYQKQYQKAYRIKHRDKIVARERIRRAANRERYNQYAKTWRERHPEAFKESNRNNVRKIESKRKSQLDELRRIGCSRCGVTQGIRLCFHHIEGSQTKEFNLSGSGTLSQERVDEELKKCEVLCNSCHMKLHNPQQFRVYTKKRA